MLGLFHGCFWQCHICRLAFVGFGHGSNLFWSAMTISPALEGVVFLFSQALVLQVSLVVNCYMQPCYVILLKISVCFGVSKFVLINPTLVLYCHSKT